MQFQLRPFDSPKNRSQQTKNETLTRRRMSSLQFCFVFQFFFSCASAKVLWVQFRWNFNFIIIDVYNSSLLCLVSMSVCYLSLAPHYKNTKSRTRKVNLLQWNLNCMQLMLHQSDFNLCNATSSTDIARRGPLFGTISTVAMWLLCVFKFYTQTVS